MARPTTSDSPSALRQGFGFGLWGHGAVSIAAEQARTNTAYGTLGTEDQVEDVAVPANGLVLLGYQAAWKESVNSAASAAIFIDGNQLKLAQDNQASPVEQFASIGGDVDAGTYKPLSTFPGGLAGVNATNPGDTAYTGDVTTGQLLGHYRANHAVASAFGWCLIHSLPAGTYTFSVQFKATSGTVTVKQRKLWVASIGFE